MPVRAVAVVVDGTQDTIASLDDLASGRDDGVVSGPGGSIDVRVSDAERSSEHDQSHFSDRECADQRIAGEIAITGRAHDQRFLAAAAFGRCG